MLISAFNCSTDSESKLKKLKRVLDGLVGKEVECEVVFDHRQSSAHVDCIIYYVPGFRHKKLLKCTVCVLCRRGLVVNETYFERPVCTSK